MERRIVVGEIKAVSHTHAAIMDYMLANPTVHLGDVAKNFGYTQAWLSQIIHSDAFQAMLKEKQNVAFHHTVLPIREKMTELAHMALDKTLQLLPQEVDVRTAQDIAEGMLDRLGFGAKPIGGTGGVNLTVNQQNNMIVPNTNAAEIAAARELLAARSATALGVQVDGVSIPLALPRASSSQMGEAILEGSVSPSGGEDSFGEGRAEI